MDDCESNKYKKNNFLVILKILFIIIISFVSTNNVFAVTLLSDDFTGTTINTSKWVEYENQGSGDGGSLGNVIQNGTLTVAGNTDWSSNGLKSISTFDRSSGDITINVDWAMSDCTATTGGLAYGNWVNGTLRTGTILLARSGGSYKLWAYSTNVVLTGVTCINNNSIHARMVIKQAGGVDVYIDGSETPNASLNSTQAPNTWNNHPISLQQYSTSIQTFDNLVVSQGADPTSPDSPTSLSAIPGDGQAVLTWTAPVNNGGADITDYLVEYKLSSEPTTWSTFSDGTSVTTSATVTGLTNSSSYDFRVSAVNSVGAGTVSSTAVCTPVLVVPAVPVAVSVSISGNALVGQTLTGAYTFTDSNSDSEATSLFRWLQSDTVNGSYSVISGATSISHTVTSDSLNKYIKFEVTPVAAVSPTTGDPVLSSATSLVTEVNYLNHILSTGQSLSVGHNGAPALSTTQPYTNKMLSGTSLVDLVEATVETMSSALANIMTSLSAGVDYQSVVTRHGVSGTAYAGLKKGTAPYNNGMTQATNVKNAAIALGRVSKVIAVTSVHGESDHIAGNGSSYESYLVEWQNDYNTDVKLITGQTDDIPLFIDQMSSWTGYDDTTSLVPIAQLSASINNPGDIILVGPKYFLNYSDSAHLTNSSYRKLGEYYGKVIKKVVIDNETWLPLSPDTVVRTGNIIYANFHVPEGQLVFDTTLVVARTNYGFEYYDSTSSATISSVEILDTDTVKVTLSNTPTGSDQRLRYAYTGVSGTRPGAQFSGSAAGNLRDTDSTVSLYGNTLYNWAVHFDEVITSDATAPTVLNVSSDKNNSSYGVGEVIDIDITFSETVTSTGNVTVTLETGDNDRTCTFTITNSSSGTCNYTVQAGDTTSDLNIKTISGTINDQVNNIMVNFAPTTNLSTNKQLIIDTSGSVISTIASTPSNTTSNITWSTDENSSSIVDYGITSDYTISTIEADTSPRVLEHTVTLSSLISCTTYHYRVRSKDTANNSATSSDGTFKTTGCTGSAPIIRAISEVVATSTGAIVELNEGTAKLVLNIPINFDEDVDDDVVFQINHLTTDTLLLTTGNPTNRTVVGSHTYDLSALIDTDTVITNFDQPLTLTIIYTDNELGSLDENSLSIYYWDGNSWESLENCSVNVTDNTVSCTTTHFTTFGVFGSSVSTYNTTTKKSRCRNCDLATIIQKNNFSTSTALTKNLGIGSKDKQVLILQKFLNQNGFRLTENGSGSFGYETDYFGELTSKSISRFQDKYKISYNNLIFEKGFLGTTTRELINSIIYSQTNRLEVNKPKNISIIFENTLYKTTQSDDVYRLQQILSLMPEIYPEALITGYYGDLTEKAIQRFQLKYLIVNSKDDKGYGVFGPKTIKKLQEVY